MKYGIFISYSDFDREKVELIVDELKDNSEFYPIVIASNREALKPLAQKVIDGIIEAKVILPILTKQSIQTQWINQEIGYAKALNKFIMPIVEIGQIDYLKGFIHKQIDLPYNFRSYTEKVEENIDFLSQVKKLITDLKEESHKLVDAKEPIEKSDFEISLELADKLNEELNFKNQRISYLNSIESVNDAKNEILKMFDDFEEKIKKFQAKNIKFSFEKEVYNPVFIIKGEDTSISIAWRQHFANSIEGATLLVKKWHGKLTNGPAIYYFPGKEPRLISDDKYSFDIDRDNTICWLNQKDKKRYNSEKIVDNSFGWLLDQIAKNKLNQ